MLQAQTRGIFQTDQVRPCSLTLPWLTLQTLTEVLRSLERCCVPAEPGRLGTPLLPFCARGW